MYYEEKSRETKIKEHIKSMLDSSNKHIISNVKWKFGERICAADIDNIRKEQNVNHINTTPTRIL